ncbi:MAG: 16S rRNA (guanine(966)-N(2))-methyltransferase RsmD [Clostridia bacterium]|nr:16S rRNA (guanine(966)-N(2))-methyltransferase RsmD [Clostridia bacterium]
MRVIAGKYKGRSLVAPKQDTRPTLDRMKETLFNILNFKLQNATVLDMFAGSGQLAIESLSRGANRVVLCDNSREAVVAIKENYEKIELKPELYCCDYMQCLLQLNCQFDIVFVDPPYKSGLYQNVLCKLCELNLLADAGIVVCEHLAETDLPCEIGCLQKYDTRKMGTVKFDFYKRSELCE